MRFLCQLLRFTRFNYQKQIWHQRQI
jgi:hypothetical protein